MTDYDALCEDYAAAIRELRGQLAAANERAGKLNRQLVELQDVIDSRDTAAGFEEVPALSPEARQAFRAAVQEIDGVNLREVERVRKEHSECIDYYEAKLVEVERKLDEYSAEVERLRGLWRPITDAPQFNNTPALVGQYSEGYGWRKVSLWDARWTRDECIERGATHWMPHLRDLPIPAALAGEKP